MEELKKEDLIEIDGGGIGYWIGYAIGAMGGVVIGPAACAINAYVTC